MLSEFANWLAYGVLGLSSDSRLGASVQFFIYDSVKIFLLLMGLVCVIGVLRTYLPREAVRRWMERGGGTGNFYAALFGAVTPFCSCSSIPIFIGFLEAGVPAGAAFSFLVTSPIINEYLVVLMAGFFGWKITVLYVVSGLMIGTVAGLLLGRVRMPEGLLAGARRGGDVGGAGQVFPDFLSRLRFGWEETEKVVGAVWVWILLGVALGAAIHNYVPQDTVQDVIRQTGVWSVPAAVVLGVPMYGGCAAIVPVAVVLFQKGVPLGTALSFLMAVSALSFPEAVILRRVMGGRLVALFFGVTAAAIVLTGYLFNVLQAVMAG